MARCVSGLNSCLKVLFNTESPAVLRGVGSNPTLVNIFVLFHVLLVYLFSCV